MKQNNLDKICYMEVQKDSIICRFVEPKYELAMLKGILFETTARHHTNIKALLQVGIVGINTLQFTSRLRYFPNGSTSPLGPGLLIA